MSNHIIISWLKKYFLKSLSSPNSKYLWMIYSLLGTCTHRQFWERFCVIYMTMNVWVRCVVLTVRVSGSVCVMIVILHMLWSWMMKFIQTLTSGVVWLDHYTSYSNTWTCVHISWDLSNPKTMREREQKTSHTLSYVNHIHLYTHSL